MRIRRLSESMVVQKTFIFIIISMLFTLSVDAQRFVDITPGGNLKICDMNTSYVDNCSNAASGVRIAAISQNKIAILYQTNRLRICDVDGGNYISNCSQVADNVSNVLLINDNKIVITYINRNSRMCGVNGGNYIFNCSTIY